MPRLSRWHVGSMIRAVGPSTGSHVCANTALRLRLPRRKTWTSQQDRMARAVCDNPDTRRTIRTTRMSRVHQRSSPSLSHAERPVDSDDEACVLNFITHHDVLRKTAPTWQYPRSSLVLPGSHRVVDLSRNPCCWVLCNLGQSEDVVVRFTLLLAAFVEPALV